MSLEKKSISKEQRESPNLPKEVALLQGFSHNTGYPQLVELQVSDGHHKEGQFDLTKDPLLKGPFTLLTAARERDDLLSRFPDCESPRTKDVEGWGRKDSFSGRGFRSEFHPLDESKTTVFIMEYYPQTAEDKKESLSLLYRDAEEVITLGVILSKRAESQNSEKEYELFAQKVALTGTAEISPEWVHVTHQPPAPTQIKKFADGDILKE